MFLWLSKFRTSPDNDSPFEIQVTTKYTGKVVFSFGNTVDKVFANTKVSRKQTASWYSPYKKIVLFVYTLWNDLNFRVFGHA